ncbi:hypothetical protein RB595_008815 [Gaeumannomyces hyphopodioides]
MADPFSIAASAISLAAIAAHTSTVLSSLCSEVKNAPALVLALSNEVDDLKLVLDRVSTATASLTVPAVPALGSASNATPESRLRDMLARAKGLLVELDILSRQLAGLDGTAQRIKWQFSKSKAESLKDRLRSTNGSLMHILVSSNLASSTRIELELHDIRVVIPQSHSPTLQALGALVTDTTQAFDCLERSLADNHQQTQEALAANRELSLPIARDLNFIKESMMANTAAANDQAVGLQNIMAVLEDIHSANQGSRDVLLTRHAIPAEQKTPQVPDGFAKQPAMPPMVARGHFAGQGHGVAAGPVEPFIRIAVAPTGSRCERDCGCRCHTPRVNADASLRLPGPLRSLFGKLLLGYTGCLTARSSCNEQTCRRGKYARLQLSYSFPAWFARHKVSLLLEASTSRRFALGLVARRRVPRCMADHILSAATDLRVEVITEMIRLDPSKILDVYIGNGRSALHLTLDRHAGIPTNNEWIKQVEVLIQAGIDPDYEDDYGVTAKTIFSRAVLLVKAHRGNEIWQAIPSLVKTALHVDLEISYLQKIILGICPVDLESVLDHGGKEVLAQVNSPTELNCPPLELAATLDDAAAVRSLLRAGARREIPVHQGRSMQAAARLKSPQCLRELLEVAGFGIEKADECGCTPLMAAILSNSTPCTVAMLEAGADVRARSKNGFTPLHFAARADNIVAAGALLRAGAEIDAVVKDGIGTPLMVAARFDCLDVLQYLLNMGADLSLCEPVRKWTVLRVAASVGSERTLDLMASTNLSVINLENGGPEIMYMRRLFDMRLVWSPGERKAFERLMVALETAHRKDRANVDEDDTATEWSSGPDVRSARNGSDSKGIMVAGGEGTNDAASDSSDDWNTAEEDNGE